MEDNDSLAKIAAEIKACRKCPLGKTAHRAVPGEGNPRTKIVFIGEAPGYWEDQRGIPFCGAAGNLLNELLASINLKREDIFITNILKHRPPNNRDPLPGEIKLCSPFLKRQLLVIKPKVVITLGRFAMNFFLPNLYISRAHGQPRKITWEGIPLLIIPLFHPAAALRNGEVMEKLKEDFLKIPQIIKEATNPPPKEETPIQGSLF